MIVFELLPCYDNDKEEMEALTEERKHFILEVLEQNHIVKTGQLANDLNTSISTIRRDLQELEAEHRLKRVHGGAVKIEPLQQERTLTDKVTENKDEKQKIAQYAAQLILDHEVIFLDAGSTTFNMIPYLKDKQITVVTNAITHANELANLNVPTFILGGMIKATTKAIINTTALQQLETMQFDRCFIGTNAIHPTFGFETPDMEEANIKSIAIQHSRDVFVLADHTKFTASSFANFAHLEEATIITDTISCQEKELCKQKTIIKEIQ